MKKIYFLIAFLSLFLVTVFESKASHIMGGEITWECLGNGDYQFEFKVYRDCSGANIAPEQSGVVRIHNYPSIGQVTTIPTSQWTVVRNGDLSPNCPSAPGNFSCSSGSPESAFEYVRRFTRRLVGVPPPAGWIITYSDFARNSNDNIVGTPGASLRAKIFRHSGTVSDTCVDNSPKFRELATSLICIGRPFTYNPNATDNELDSLVYDWARPLNQNSGNSVFVEGVQPPNVNFQSGYSFNSPFPGTSQDPNNVPATLDRNTGEITLTSFTGGKYVSVVKVTAYKCGERVAEIYRELQTNLANSSSCTNNDKPIITPPFRDASNNFTIWNDTVRAGDLVTFNIQSQDFASLAQSGGDSLTLTATGLQFGTNFTSTTGCNNPPCATLTSSLPQKGFLGVNNTFSWQTDCNHVSFTDQCVSGQNTYTFVVKVEDDVCPLPAENIATISITVLADSVLLSPLINCVNVNSNGDVDLDWNVTPNIQNSFSAWMIYSATDANGPYSLVDSVKTYNQSTYTHVGAGADTQRRWYYIRSRSGCKGIVQNVARDTVSTIFVDPQVAPTELNVNWNPVGHPNPAGSNSQYRVFKEYPIGTGFNFYQNSTSSNLAETFNVCEDSVTYRVELVNSAESCTSSSNIAGIRFKFPDPQTDFDFSPATPCPNSPISFTNQTTIPGGALSYVWDFGDGSPTVTQENPSHTYSLAGNYTVTLTATSGIGCDSVFSQTINVTFPNADAGPDAAICPGGNVSIGGSPTTGAGNTVAWSPSAGLSSTTVQNPVASPNSTTTYTVTVTDANSCTNTDQVVVSVNAVPTADAGADQNLCAGSTVTIGGSPTGPTGATYQWDNVGTLNDASLPNPDASPLSTTTYSVTVTSGVNCSATDQVTITVDPSPNVDAGADQTICPGATATIGGSPTSTAAGASYAWDNTASLSSSTASNPIATPTSTTTYTVTVTDGNSCTSTDQVTITVSSGPTADAGSDKTICLGGNTSIGGSPTGPSGAAYAWDNSASLSSSSVANPTANPTSTTTYTVTVTDGNSCTSTDQVTVNVVSLPTADAGSDQSICIGATATIGGSPTGPSGATYQWSNSGSLTNASAANPVASPAVTTTYTVTVTAGPSCTSTDQVTVTVNPLPTADAGPNKVLCTGNTVTIGSANNPNYTYQWSNTATIIGSSTISEPTVRPAVTTTYTVTVTDMNSCTDTDQVTVTVGSPPNSNAGPDRDLCIGSSIVIGGSSSGVNPLSFSWDNGASLSSPNSQFPIASPTVTTTYTVTVTDGNGCTSTDQMTVTVNPLPTADAGADQTICEGSNASLGGSPTGPSGATFAWDNAASLSSSSVANPVANPTVTTTYTVTVTDGNSCSETDQVTITVDPAPNVDAGSDQTICDGTPVSIGGSPTSTTPGVSYAWDNSASLDNATIANPTANPTSTTTYTVTVTDGNSCTSTDQVTVTVNALPVADAGSDQTICDGSSATIGGSPTGPSGSTYNWSNGASLDNSSIANPVATPTATTTYTVTVTNSASCTSTDQVTITVNPTPNVDAGADQTICDGASVTIGGSPTSTSAGVSYAWDNGSSLSNATVANPIANPTSTTTYTVTVTDGNSCTSTDQMTVTVNPLPTADAGADQTICDGQSTPIGGSPTGPSGATYAWDNAASLSSSTVANPSASPTSTTTYTVTVTDGNSCTSTDQVTITVDPLPAVDAGADQTICEGSNATLGGSPTGPSGSTFAWDNASSLSSSSVANPVANPTVTTTYTVTVTDGNSCSETDQVTITVNPAPNVDAGADQSICDGASVTIGGSPTSSTAGVSYAWDNSASLDNATIANPTANPTSTTTYTVTVTDGNSCTSTDQVTITVNPLPTADAGADRTICEGSTANLGGTPTGPSGSTYSWDNASSLNNASASNPIATPLSTTTYSVTVTDNNGCTNTDQVTITVNPAPSADAGSDQTICEGENVTLGGSPTGPSGASYSWNNSASLSSSTAANPIANPTTTTTYTVTVTDLSLCTATDQVTITVNPSPSADAGADQTICDGASAIIGGSPTSSASGATYAWDNGASLDNSTIANPTATPSVTTTYTVTVTDANLCTSTDQLTITVNPLPTVDAGSDQTICEGSNATLGGSPTGPSGSTFAWDNASSLSSSSVANPVANPIVTTTYTVTVTDGNSCSETDQVTITVNPAPNADAGADQSICDGASVTIGGSPTSSTAGVSYAWDNSASLDNATIANPTASPTSTTTYTVTVTDGNSCTSTDQMTVTVNPLPTADAGADQAICDGQSATIGGSPTGPSGATYAWDNAASLSSSTVANPTANPTSTTTYTVTVTDGNSCSSTDQVVITVNPLPTADAGADQTICNGQNVSIGGSPTGPSGATYAWDNAASLSSSTVANPTANPTSTTTYTVTVTDVNSCTSTDQVTVTVNPLPTADAGADQAICDGQSATIGGSPTGPSGATYAWDNAASLDNATIANPTANPTATTTYTVTVTDGNSCTSTDQVTITVNPLPIADAGADQAICDGQSATIGGSPTGPSGATYAWDNAASLDNATIANPTATPTSTTTYTVTVTDGNSCTSTDQVTITVNPLPTVDAGANQTICDGNSVTIGGSPTSSTAGVSYAWDNAASLDNATIANPTATPTSTTTYTVTVTDGNSCTSTDQVTITVNPLPLADAGSDRDICIGSTATLGGSPTGPAGSTYSWDNAGSLSDPSVANPVASPTTTTTYTVTVTDGNSCSSTDQVTITVNPLPVADAGSDQTICNSFSVTLGGSPTGPAGATYTWDNAGTLNNSTIANPSASPSSTTTYTVTVTDGNSCTSTDQVTITVNPLPTVDFNFSNTCLSEVTNFSDLSSISSGSIVSWNWDFGDGVGSSTQQNPSYQYASAGTFDVQLIVESDNNCLDSLTKTITIDPLPIVDFSFVNTCLNDDVQFSDLSTIPTGNIVSWDWDFGDGSGSSTQQNPTYQYLAAGSYTVQLIVQSDNGCLDSTSKTITITTLPDIDVGVDQTICNTDSVMIGGSPTSSTSGVTYSWNNASTLSNSTDPNPMAAPSDTTTYILVVSDGVGCVSIDSVVVNVNPLPNVEFQVDELCEGDFTAFTDQTNLSVGNISSWNWDFGDGSGSSTVQNPAYQYLSSGTYDVKLTVTTAEGCSDSLSKEVEVNELPIADAGDDQAICFGDTVELGGDPSGDPEDSFSWSPASDLSDVTATNPLAYPLSTTAYYLSVTDDNGCFNFDTVEVTVNPLPNVVADEDTFSCVGGPIQLLAQGADTYSWEPSTWLDNPSISNPISEPLKDIRYVVTGVDLNGCEQTDTVSISVFNLDFIPSDTAFCRGDSVQLEAVIQGDTTGITYQWTPASSLNNASIRTPFAFPMFDERYELAISNSVGCTDVDSIDVVVNDSAGVNFEFVASPRCSGAVVELENTSVSTDEFEWSLNGSFMTRDRNPSFEIDHSIDNFITLVGSNANCTNSISKRIPAASFTELLDLKESNVFTPNGDGVNDIFDPGFEGEFIGCFGFKIYDRWGNKVFDSNIGQYGWDGTTMRGQKAKVGTYFYIITIAQEEIKGSVFLSR